MDDVEPCFILGWVYWESLFLRRPSFNYCDTWWIKLASLRPTFFMFTDELTPVMFTFAKTLLEMLVWAVLCDNGLTLL